MTAKRDEALRRKLRTLTRTWARRSTQSMRRAVKAAAEPGGLYAAVAWANAYALCRRELLKEIDP
jgi:hypothetical protein